ncbi:MAG: glycosyltransferase family 39 protein [Candidatus Eremiobacteraeota bacterium]|nr:glycosyltransferase family 39 protein [Candidatus Eremiobacteraeota bacterium]
MTAVAQSDFSGPNLRSRPSRAAVIVRFGAFALVFLLYFVRLGAGTLWDNSEPTYGEIVKELFRTNDWLTLHFNYQPWFIHPPLWFWTAGAAGGLFGLSESSLRLPSALFGLLGAVATYFAARRLYGETAGVIACLAVGTALEYIVLARLAVLDSMLLCLMTVSGFWIYFAVRDGDRAAFWSAVVAAALGTLTKGPIAVVLPVLTLFVYCLWTRRTGALPLRLWLAGALMYLLIAGSWFAAETLTFGTGFLRAYFGMSTVGRFLSPFENQPGPIYYYVPVALIGFFPYVAFLPKALKDAWRSRTDDERYLLCSIGIPLLFFSFAQTKLPNYIAVIFPACAVLVGRLFAQACARNDLRMLRGALIGLPASLLLVAIGVILYARTEHASELRLLGPALSLLGWAMLPAAALTLLVTLLSRRMWVAPVGLGVMMAGFVAALTFSILPRIETLKPMRAMSKTVMSYWRPGDRIGVTGVAGGFSLLFYTEARGVTFVGTAHADESPQQFFGEPGRLLCVILPQDVEGLQKIGIHVRVLARRPKMWLVTNSR